MGVVASSDYHDQTCPAQLASPATSSIFLLTAKLER